MTAQIRATDMVMLTAEASAAEDVRVQARRRKLLDECVFRSHVMTPLLWNLVRDGADQRRYRKHCEVSLSACFSVPQYRKHCEVS